MNAYDWLWFLDQNRFFDMTSNYKLKRYVEKWLVLTSRVDNQINKLQTNFRNQAW